MLYNRPLLLAWGAGTLYLYEFITNVGFKILSSATVDGTEVELKFMKDQITGVSLARATSLVLRTHKFTLDNYATRTETLQVAKLDVSKVSRFIALHKGQSSVNTNGICVKDDDTFTAINSIGLTLTTLKSIALHPNDDYYLACSANNNSYVLPKCARDAFDPDMYEYPYFNATTSIWNVAATTKLNDRVRLAVSGLGAGNILACAWTNAGDYAYLVSDNNNIYTYAIENETSSSFEFNKLFTTIFSNTPVAIRVRPDDKQVAVSVINGSSQYLTYIYVKKGYTLTLMQTITNFGRQFDWSADGKMLIDATSKRLFIYNPATETYEENFTYMADIASDITSQAVNKAAISKIPQAYLFNVSKSNLASRTGIDLNNLKLMLLDSDATYDHTETSILDISAANEVSGNGWPVGGVLLANVGYSVVNGKACLIADDIIQEISGVITFDNAVLYDAVSGNPIVWYPSISTTIEKDTMITFNMSNGIVTIDS